MRKREPVCAQIAARLLETYKQFHGILPAAAGMDLCHMPRWRRPSYVPIRSRSRGNGGAEQADRRDELRRCRSVDGGGQMSIEDERVVDQDTLYRGCGSVVSFPWNWKGSARLQNAHFRGPVTCGEKKQRRSVKQMVGTADNQ